VADRIVISFSVVKRANSKNSYNLHRICCLWYDFFG